MSFGDIAFYEEAWRHYSSRFEQKYEKFTECFTSLTEKTPVREARSMISVGVADAVFDLMILEKALPKIEHVIAIEPDPKFNEIMPKAFGTLKGRKIKLDVQNTIFEDYKGPDSPVDLILLANVLPFFMDTAEHQIEKCHKWLNPRGHLVVAINTTTSLPEAYDGLQREGWHSAFNGPETMKLVNIQYTDERTVDVLFDLREENIEHIMWVLTGKRLKNEEIQIFMDKIKKHQILGTTNIVSHYSFYLEPKKLSSVSN